MSDIGEGLGSAASGGFLARAIEPDSGLRKKHPDQPENCLNCDTLLVGAYCHACGQVGHTHRTIGAFGHDLLHGALHFEGKFWRTLPMLAFRPGRLTRRYIEGARARFVSPMALFLFSVFLMFAVFTALGLTAPTSFPELEGARQAISQDQSTQSDEPQSDAIGANAASSDAPAEQTKQVIPIDDDGNARLSINATGIDWIDDGLVRKWEENPGLMLYKLQANTYKFSWLIIPISIPFVWLLFAWKRRFNTYDHAIFVTYSLCFMTLLFVVLSLLGKAGVPAGWIVTAALIIPPLHIYKHLRGTYALSRFSAFWRLLVLAFLILIIVMMFMQVLVVLGTF